MSKGPVESQDLFPQKDFYAEKPDAARPKMPLKEIAEVLMLQDEEIGLIIVKKRETGGYVAATTSIEKSKKNISNELNLAFGRVKKSFLEMLKHG